MFVSSETSFSASLFQCLPIALEPTELLEEMGSAWAAKGKARALWW